MLGLNSFLNTEKIRAWAIEGRNEVVQTHSRKAFYKISLLSGRGVIQYESHHFEVNGSTLLLSMPGTVCYWKLISTEHPSFTTIFTEDFLDKSCFHGVAESQLFQSDQVPVFKPDPEQTKFLASVFRIMIGEQNSLYRFKSELMQNHICLLLHSALRMKPAQPCMEAKALASTLTTLFVELVEMQFSPVAQLVHYN